jgi:isopenicillin N synthase-like dioxygenase
MFDQPPVLLYGGAALLLAGITLWVISNQTKKRGVPKTGGQNNMKVAKATPSRALPAPILISDILSSDKKKGTTELCDAMMRHGFVVLRDDDEGVNKIRDCRAQVSQFFDSPKEEKLKHEVFVESVAGKRRVNRGYIPQDQKEFFKMRLIDGEEAFPAQKGLFRSFSAAMNHMHDVARCSFEKLALGPGDGQRWVTDDTLENTGPFRERGSSLSVIRYFDMSQKREEEEHVPCDAHYDTGILTMILLSEVPGLQVENRETKEWIPIEKVGRPGDFALIMGRKIDLLAKKEVGLQPTYHRVQIPSNVVRHSILFFYDLQTSPHD